MWWPQGATVCSRAGESYDLSAYQNAQWCAGNWWKRLELGG